MTIIEKNQWLIIVNPKHSVTKTMKFSQINIGDKFFWKNIAYRKVSPIIAKDTATGSSIIVPKYVNIESDDPQIKEEKKPATTDQLLDYFIKMLSQNIDSLSLSDSDKEKVTNEIMKTRQSVF
ncbi:MAG: hypothetical protein OEY29_05255 [Gammaproteobacteria bacterium]|nr:hypothetical protein [Gammaproteobacteria bacterium]